MALGGNGLALPRSLGLCVQNPGGKLLEKYAWFFVRISKVATGRRPLEVEPVRHETTSDVGERGPETAVGFPLWYLA